MSFPSILTMKKSFLVLLLLGLWSAGIFSSPAQSLPERRDLTLVTYNIRHGLGLDGRTDYARIGRLLKASGADVVALQEVDSATQRSRGCDVLHEIADEALMYPVFARSMAFDGGAYGVGLLLKEHPLRVERVPLPGREEPRVLLVAELTDCCVACTHLSLTPADQLASLPVIRRVAERYDKPFFLAGDWNALPTDSTLKLLQRDFRLLSAPRTPTYPADRPQQTLDYVALWRPTAKRVALHLAQVLNEPVGSDHRPVAVSVRLLQPVGRVFYGMPYLQRPTSDGVTVMCQTRVPAHVWVEFGTDTLHLQRAQTLVDGQAKCHEVLHRVRLDGLEGGRTCYYRVCAREIADNQAYSKTLGDTVRSRFYRFTPPSPRGTDFTALVLNDLHLVARDEAALAQVARSVKPDFICFNGDCLPEPATREEAVRHVQRLVKLFDGAQVPLCFIRGNHEIRNAYSSGMPELFDYPGGHSYGAFSWGDTRLVVLDCGEDKPDTHWVYYGLNDFQQFREEQRTFLQQEMRQRAFRRAARRVLLCHIPLWGNSDAYQPCPALWGDVLRRARFDVELSAHTHQFAYYPKDSIGNPFPVCIGGGPGAVTYMLLQKRGRQLSLTVKDLQGRVLRKVDL